MSDSFRDDGRERGNADGHRSTIAKVMSCPLFIEGYIDGWEGRPFAPHIISAWSYERGRLFAAWQRGQGHHRRPPLTKKGQLIWRRMHEFARLYREGVIL